MSSQSTTPQFDQSQNSNVVNGVSFTANAANAAANVFIGPYPGAATVVGGIWGGVVPIGTNYAVAFNSANGQTLFNGTVEVSTRINNAEVTNVGNGVFAVTGETRCTGNFVVQTAGKGIQLQSGAGQRGGNATLVGGTVTVANTTVTAKTCVQLTRKTPSGTLGAGGYAYTLSTGTSFTINSVDLAGVLSVLDTSVITYELYEVN